MYILKPPAKLESTVFFPNPARLSLPHACSCNSNQQDANSPVYRKAMTVRAICMQAHKRPLHSVLYSALSRFGSTSSPKLWRNPRDPVVGSYRSDSWSTALLAQTLDSCSPLPDNKLTEQSWPQLTARPCKFALFMIRFSRRNNSFRIVSSLNRKFL